MNSNRPIIVKKQYLKVFFPEKPSPEICKLLREHLFVWSRAEKGWLIDTLHFTDEMTERLISILQVKIAAIQEQEK